MKLGYSLGDYRILAISLVFVLTLLISNCSADCCIAPGRNKDGVYYCNDGTTTSNYCGYGDCNMFGCWCKGGCRQAKNKEECKNFCDQKYDTKDGSKEAEREGCRCLCDNWYKESQRSQDTVLSEGASNNTEGLRIFSLIDTNSDGSILIEEFELFLNGETDHPCMECGNSTDFAKMDIDNSGDLTLDEIDDTSVNYLLTLKDAISANETDSK